MTAPEPEAATKQFKCEQCGAKLEFHPGAASQKCPYCSFETAIPQSEEDIQELDFHTYLSEAAAAEDTVEAQTVKCEQCGAETTLDPNVASDACAFCGSTLVTIGGSHREMKPKSLLPFKVTQNEAFVSFRNWLNGLWFAPGALKKYADRPDRLQGLYVPYWTYDCSTVSYYRGERGEDYWEEEEYEDEDSEGNKVTRTRRVRKTRWYPASGTVWEDFDDILVLASRSLPKTYTDALEPWDLENLEAYQDEFLSGFRAETYQVGLEEGFTEAREIMDDAIRQEVRRDIGGDRQRIHSVRTRHSNITFKHILLPIWLSAYRYRETAYRFLVNARTGEVQGERPWSWIKITLAVIAAAAVITTVVLVAQG